jgi:ADP-heptose:LPS heptosyltransferase
VSVSDEQRLGELLESKNIPRNAYLVLNPNAGRLSLERRWARNHFAELSEQIHENTDLHVILIGSPSEREYTAGLGQLTKHLPRLHDFAGKLSIGELCALLRGARAVITNDSGPMHLSAALGAPTLGLFGPETPLMYEPMGSQAQYIYKPTICSPCINVHQGKVATCIHSRPECLENISAVEVWDWLRSALNNKGSQAPAALRVLDA